MLLVAAWLLCAAVGAWAGGPRFVTGTNAGGAPSGQFEAFYTSTPQYYTDPGDLAPGVSHAQADALVAAAAAVWNVPTSSLVLARGGALAEHVSSANAYFDGTQIVFPADVQASNYGSKPIAILYDSDGSVTDLLLGDGASLPSGCRQNGVTESVDGFGSNGTIQHALLILNGRCVGSTPEQITQMQYQVMRAFGRVLGLAWSQCNDNVFTGVPTATRDQLSYWPVMHPIDIVCGPYTYQCMQNPFSLRADDISAMAMLYPVTQANLTAGKAITLTNGNDVLAQIMFPTGQRMSMVNMTVHVVPGDLQILEGWEEASAVSGGRYLQNIGNPVTGAESGSENVGGPSDWMEGYFEYGLLTTGPVASFYMTGQPINPLYTGEYALGPFQRPVIAPSGSPATLAAVLNHPGYVWGDQTTVNDAASTCAPGSDGSEGGPAAADPSGWWNGQICGWGHTSWWTVRVKAGRTWSIETTALDDSGVATDEKLQPVIGVWVASDATGTLPTVAAATAAMNSMALGVTQVNVGAAGLDGSYRIAMADQFGAGRPDFKYTARVLYADNVSPATVGAGGGPITINGMGFRRGNTVTVNGVAAQVVSWSAGQIVAMAPALQAPAGALPRAVGSGSSKAVSVAVADPSTGATSMISSALTYNTSGNTMQEVSAPAALETGVTAATPFAVRVVSTYGNVPVAGDSVSLSVTTGSAVLTACGGAQSCILTTDSSGLVQTPVGGATAGSVSLLATELSSGAQVQVILTDVDPVRSVSMGAASIYVAAGGNASWTVALQAFQDGAPAAGAPVLWTSTGAVTPGSASMLSTAGGMASLTVQAVGVTADSVSTVTGCAWSTACASGTVYGVDSSLWRVAVSSGAGQSVGSGTMFKPVTLQVTDGAGHPLQSATVAVEQTVDAWEGICPAQERCAAAPVLASAKTTAMSDANGKITVTPLKVPGVPQVVNIAISTGTTGFAVMSLTVAP